MSAAATGVVITGVTGRMGSTLVRVVTDTPGLKVVAGTERPGSSARGQDVGAAAKLGVALQAQVHEELAAALAGAAVVIDFTSPEASCAHAKVCAERGVAMVIGSTGFTPEAKEKVREAAARIPIVLAPNTSVGVNLVIRMAGELARWLGESYDVEIVEAHHRMKKDAPSGTALRLAEEVAAATGRTREHFRLAREGQVGERPRGEIGVQTLRGGDVVGEHTVFFFGDGERVELTHRATSRDQFARGAVRAARWVVQQSPGLYDMMDVLGLKDGR